MEWGSLAGLGKWVILRIEGLLLLHSLFLYTTNDVRLIKTLSVVQMATFHILYNIPRLLILKFTHTNII